MVLNYCLIPPGAWRFHAIGNTGVMEKLDELCSPQCFTPAANTLACHG
jgi:hypothetical protein